jgi:signal transduction histidine kinase
MFQASPLGFLVVDNRTDAILHFNERFCELWGITHLAAGMRRGELKNNDIIPDCLPMLVDVPAFAVSCAPLQDVDNRTTVEDEIAFVAGRTIRRYSTQIRDQLDEYHGRFYIFEDITAHKRLESEIAANLEKEREVSAMKTRFISVTSHEFRTPMAAAMMSIDTLQNHLEQLLPAKRTQLFDRIHTSMHRMTTMLDEVLVLSRMEAGRMTLQLEPIDPVAFTRAVMAEVSAGDRAAHRFEFTAEGSPGPFVTEPNLLHQILSNLLSNAVRYSPAGTPIATSLAADRAGVRVAVEDRGIGIPEADRARIFEPFERGSNVGNINGTGLGLNIVKRMTEKLGGTITYAPVPTGGSRFILILPSSTPSPS